MYELKKTILEDKDLTLFVVKGALTREDIVNEIDRMYSGKFTINSLWDFTKATLPSADHQQVQEIIAHARDYLSRRKGGKTAVIVSHDDDFVFGMMRMYSSLVDSKDSPVEYRVFKEFNDALGWLNE